MKTTTEILKSDPIIVLIKLTGLPLDCINKKDECVVLIKSEINNVYNKHKKGFNIYGYYKTSINKNEDFGKTIDLAHFVLVEEINF